MSGSAISPSPLWGEGRGEGTQRNRQFLRLFGESTPLSPTLSPKGRGSSIPFFLVLLALLFAATPASAAPYQLLDGRCFATSARGDLPAAAVAAAQYRCEVGYQDGSRWVWARAVPPPTLAITGAGWMLIVNQSRYAALRVIVMRSDGSVDDRRYDATALRGLWVPGARFAVPLAPAAAPVSAIYVGFAQPGSTAFLLTIAVDRYAAIDRDIHQWLVAAGLFTGLLTACLLFNLFLFGGERSAFRLVYLGWMLLTLGYGLLWSAIGDAVLPAMAGRTGARLLYAFSAWTVAASVALVPLFVGRSRMPRVLAIPLDVLAIALALFGTLGALDQLGLAEAADAVMAPLALLAQLLTLAGLGVALTRHMPGARLWTLGTVLPAAAVLFHVLWGYELLGPNIVSEAGIFLATGLQALLLSAGTAQRLGAMRAEREAGEVERRRLLALAETDAATGTANRAALARQIDAALGRGTAVALLLIDLAMAGAGGIEAGDELMARIARALRAAAPPESGHIVARVAERGFAVAAIGRDADAIALTGERLRLALARIDLAGLAATAPLAAAMGAAIRPAGGGSFETLFVEADRALARARISGAGRLMFASA